MLLKTVFHNAVQRLKQAGIPDPELEVSLLLSHVLHMERTAVLLAGEMTLEPEQLDLFDQYISRRLTREPLAYIIGEKEFWSLPFTVTKDVLIPRPETEFLLEKTIARLKGSLRRPQAEIRILDLGTGSGVIAIILARESVSARVTAIDCSYGALQVAGHNAKKHGVAERIDFLNSDWFAAIKPCAEFDAVISNPPYISRETLARPFGQSADALQPEVGNFEPCQALDGGEGGMREIGRIAAELGNFLKPGGWLFMEIGAEQGEDILAVFSKTDVYDSLQIFHDYAGLPRVFQARKK